MGFLILKRGKVSWLKRDDDLIAFDKFQATVYPTYGNSSRGALLEMEAEILRSKQEYNWVDVISLARKYNVIGFGARLREEWFCES